MSDTARGLRPGDKLPFCYGMDHRTQAYWSFEEQAGRPCVLVAVGDVPPSALSGLIEAFAAPPFAASDAPVRLLPRAGASGWATATVPSPLELVHNLGSDLSRGGAGGVRVLVADRALRLVAEIDAHQPPQGVANAAARALQSLAGEPLAPAPVLIAPRVLDRDACARLIARFEAGGHAEGAMASEDADGAAIRRIDPSKKRRRDLALDPCEPLHAEIVEALSTRLVPEIAKAFQARVAHLDRILIARYDDTGGWFRRHRDNSSAHLAYREFAVSLNLNTGDYDGGELLFPEFDDHRHSPPAGGALVFSASLLHEALPVTRGARYVALSFLHGEAAEQRRLAALAQPAAA